jgi:predicted metal-dependent hydrolase
VSFAFLRRDPLRRTAWPEQLTLAGRTVPLVVAVPAAAARRLTLRADAATGTIRLSLPRGTGVTAGKAFLDAQMPWLAARVARWPSPRPIAPGATLPLRGEPVVVDWAAANSRVVRFEAGRLMVGGPVESLAGRVERWLRREALAALTADCDRLAARIDRPPPPVCIADPRGRWGSCSARGSLRFSWRLVMAPEWVRTAVAAHEVAHLVHHDHGSRFHALCAELSGGTARAATRWLAAAGAALHWVGRG